MENLTGWVCPKCGRVYSPFMPECGHCNGSMNIQPIQPQVQGNTENTKDMAEYVEKYLGMPKETFYEWTEGEMPKEGGA